MKTLEKKRSSIHIIKDRMAENTITIIVDDLTSLPLGHETLKSSCFTSLKKFIIFSNILSPKSRPGGI
jgi:hypothetical protein